MANYFFSWVVYFSSDDIEGVIATSEHQGSLQIDQECKYINFENL